MQKRIFCRVFMALTIISTACEGTDKKREAENTAQEFAEAYFSYDYGKAALYVTDDSRRWIEFKASNIGEDDINTLRDQDRGPSVEITDADLRDESNATVSVSVSNFFETDSIGGSARMVDEASFDLKLQLEADGKWRIRMEGPLRSGR